MSAFTREETETRGSEPKDQAAEARVAVGPLSSFLYDPNLGPHIWKPTEPLAWPSLDTRKQLSVTSSISVLPCCLLTTEKSH